ncbi:WD repeat, SAM and U-box domain-containing protein 1-like isoform X2 [Macrosteles quadrilineatus]|uniref:WD repeat, SAM and U-box domain-containing protein 1-like isoform X2 n=1 Tax=Macrosteles quadrilineatus TaxID=74068 RepID=UPI0023E0945F|nr:WD repeat, SAM and U-box domain-containing protein 1-like isoform X2 [Macrosteles quadrilineatus]
MSQFIYNILKTIKLAGDINSCGFNVFNTLAIGTSDKAVSVWEWTEEGYKEANYSPLLYHDYAVTSIVFAPDGSVLATSSMDGMTYLFNTKTGAVRASIVQSIGGGVRESAISSSNYQLLGTVTDEGYIFLWSLTSYQIQRYWLGHEACVACLGFSPDSYLLATGDTDGTYKLWLVDRAVSTLYMVDTLCGHIQKDAHDGGILALAFSPNHYTELVTRDYQLCTGGDDNILRLWEVSVEVVGAKERKAPKITIKFLKALEGHLSSVTCVRYSPDGCYVGSTSLDSSARLWEVSSGVCVRVLDGHKHSVFCCAFSPELGFFSSGSNDKTVNVWQLTCKPVPVKVQQPSQSEDDLEEKAMVRRYFTIFDDIKLGCNVNSLDFNTHFDLVIGCSDKMVRPFVRRGTEFKEKSSKPMKGHSYSVVNVEFSRCGRYLVTGSIDGSIIVWNYATGEMINRPFQLSIQGGRAARFSPASDWLALGSNDGKVYLWSIKTQAISFSYPGHIESINCLAFSPDGEYLATGCTAGQVKLWKANPAVTLCQLLIENVHDLGVMSCDFSQALTKIKGMSTRVYRLATGGNDSLVKVFKLWPVDELVVKAEEMFCMRGHGGSITEVRFSGKSSDVLASTAIDRTARIWNMQNGQCLNVLTHHKGQVTCCAFSPDSMLFATGSLDSSVIVWKVPKVICLNNKYDLTEQNPKRVVNPGESLDLDALRIDDVQLSLDDLVTAAKRNSVEIPEHFLCPITQQLMTEPVICEDGFTYENHAIQAWMVNGRNTSPMTNVPLSSTVVVPNTELQAEIKKFLVSRYDQHGVYKETYHTT